MAIRVDEDILPLAEFESRISGFLQQIRETRRPIVLTKDDRGVAVLMDATDYADMRERLDLLESICRAQAQLEKGEGIPHEEARARVLASLEH